MLTPSTLAALLAFRREREWEAFHAPRNLAIGISVEAAELLEHFQWMAEGEQRPTAAAMPKVEQEIADVAMLLTYLVHDLGIDLDATVQRKLTLNAERYPVETSRGKVVKYREL
jgi:NTP pyrophosphatase (non-canonical NTP hydrolase)